MKEPKPKKTLSEEMGERLRVLHEARRAKTAAEKRERFTEQEDEVMEMTHGPYWRTRYPGDPMPEDEGDPDNEVTLKAS